MHGQQPVSPAGVEMIQRTLGKPLGPGELGVLMARAGVGKTACLTHIALEHLLQGLPVLHVCIDDLPDKVKVWYHEFLKNIASSQAESDITRLQHQIEPLRFILAYLHHTFTPEKLEQSLQNLEEQAKFHPNLIILDGLDFDSLSRSMLEALKAFAQRHGVSLWMSARSHRHITVVNARGIPYPCHECDEMFDAIISLEPTPEAIRVKVLKHGDPSQTGHSEVLLNPQTFVLQHG